MFGSKLDILDQKWIDVVFSGRNKSYGAYELRRDNGRNTRNALGHRCSSNLLLQYPQIPSSI